MVFAPTGMLITVKVQTPETKVQVPSVVVTAPTKLVNVTTPVVSVAVVLAVKVTEVPNVVEAFDVVTVIAVVALATVTLNAAAVESAYPLPVAPVKVAVTALTPPMNALAGALNVQVLLPSTRVQVPTTIPRTEKVTVPYAPVGVTVAVSNSGNP
jgi:hypothetical protein